MAIALLSCQSLTKTHSARPLFDGISLGIEEGERVGLIGPNGSGKSTLLKLLAGQEKPDSGMVSPRKGLQVVYIPQEEVFPKDATVEQVLTDALKNMPLEPDEKAVRIELALTEAGFPDRAQAAATLSGGWKKRLALMQAFIREPELALLDEPTNHLDLDGVLWLETYLIRAPFAFLLVSHDRQFLENVVTRLIELHPMYEGGYFSAEGAYSDFLEKREAYLARQQQRQQGMESVVRREIEWLRRGAQARTTKAKGRIEQAGRLIGDLKEIQYRNARAESSVGGMTFSASGRMTKEMIVLKGVSKSLGGRKLFSDVDLTISPRRRIGVVGPNGSGKTTLLRLLTGELEPDTGTVRRADSLQIIWFEQNRNTLDRDVPLRHALSPNSDMVRYRESSMHVAGWAKRFLFRADQLDQPVGSLSGGEQARVLIAQLMLQPADILILDEPTNDLDIPTLEVLEESLESFPGAVVLVTHDRYLLERVSTEVVGLMEDGSVRLFADYEQYATTRAELNRPAPVVTKAAPKTVESPVRAGLSTAERRELSQMEAKIEQAEATVAQWEAALNDQAVVTDASRLQEAWESLNAAKEAVTLLYARWEALEEKGQR